MSGAHWMGTFESVFASGDLKLIASVLDTICRTERKDGMIEAAKIAASFELEDPEKDEVCRLIGREITEAALARIPEAKP